MSAVGPRIAFGIIILLILNLGLTLYGLTLWSKTPDKHYGYAGFLHSFDGAPYVGLYKSADDCLQARVILQAQDREPFDMPKGLIMCVQVGAR